jgi:diguanylate cyclase (GGDEF)-like protein
LTYAEPGKVFGQEELSVLGRFAELASLALQNARKYTEARRLSERLAHQAYHDSLTGLPNRLLFSDRLQQALADAERRKQAVALLFIDLDRFKLVNDGLGHSVGDLLLTQLGERLRRCIRRTDTLARTGGDEFTMVVTDLTDPRQAARVARKLLGALRQPFTVAGYELFVSATIGISLYPTDGRDADLLLRNADTAMYRAKTKGRSTFEFFSSAQNSAATERFRLETQLREALKHGEFVLHYQPLFDLRTGKVTAVEALLRWNRRDPSNITPASIVAVAEESGLIIPIGNWVLDQACAQQGAWRRIGYPPVPISVNISPRQFAQQDFIGRIASTLRNHEIDPHLLRLELAEALVMRDTVAAARTIEGVHALGAGIAIDDFGSGSSMLSYLARLPISAVKITQPLVKQLVGTPGSLMVIRSLVAFAHSLEIGTTALGIETEQQLEIVRQAGFSTVQGFMLGRPVLPDDLIRTLDPSAR